MSSRSLRIEPGGEFESLVAMPAEMPRRFVAILERGERNWSAYVPDVDGVVATGATEEEVGAQVREALAFHLDGLREDGEAVPEPRHQAVWILT